MIKFCWIPGHSTTMSYQNWNLSVMSFSSKFAAMWNLIYVEMFMSSSELFGKQLMYGFLAEITNMVSRSWRWCRIYFRRPTGNSMVVSTTGNNLVWNLSKLIRGGRQSVEHSSVKDARRFALVIICTCSATRRKNSSALTMIGRRFRNHQQD